MTENLRMQKQKLFLDLAFYCLILHASGIACFSLPNAEYPVDVLACFNAGLKTPGTSVGTSLE